MPELPDIDVYIASLESRIGGCTLEDVRIGNPFLLRSVEPPLADVVGRRVDKLRRIGKRIAIGLSGGPWLVIHLMVAGRLHWHEKAPALTGRNALAAFDFSSGSLVLTEAGTKKRASLHVVAGDADLAGHDPGGLEPLTSSYEAFTERLASENHTLKRALTSPRLFSGIGNAYSDEILHAARLSPVQLTSKLAEGDRRRLYEATQRVLREWRERLAAECRGKFPEKVTAFREGMAVHGRYGKPCPDCGSPVQRIRYKSNETNYCARCQTGGRVYADRALSRLLKDSWPGELEA